MASGDLLAELGYLKRLDLYRHEKPFQIFIPIEDGDRQTNLEFESRTQRIVDMRPRLDSFKLDENGFEVQTLPTSLSADQLHDPEMIKTKYLPEIEKGLNFIEGGFDRVFFFDWRVRLLLQSSRLLMEGR